MCCSSRDLAETKSVSQKLYDSNVRFLILFTCPDYSTIVALSKNCIDLSDTVIKEDLKSPSKNCWANGHMVGIYLLFLSMITWVGGTSLWTSKSLMML